MISKFFIFCPNSIFSFPEKETPQKNKYGRAARGSKKTGNNFQNEKRERQ